MDTTLPPFSEVLSRDNNLKLSDKDFIVKLRNVKNELPTRDLGSVPLHPPPGELAVFSKQVYSANFHKGTCVYYNKLVTKGWEVLTTAFNKRYGYFGAAFYHIKKRQVVIAHRGTDSLKAVYADLAGVVLKALDLGQVSSACTFTHSISMTLKQLEIENIFYKLFITGHSLGAWLAQISTMSAQHLTLESDVFLKDTKEAMDRIHTTVFDSPGCKDMLDEYRDRLDVRYDNNSSVDDLDLTIYLSAPNIINTCDKHAGDQIFRIFVDLSSFKGDIGTIGYTKATHSIDAIIKVFDSETGAVADKSRVCKVVDWPYGIFKGGERKQFFKWATRLNEYHPPTKTEELKVKLPGNYYISIRYQTKCVDDRERSLAVFTANEKEFLTKYEYIFLNKNSLFASLEPLELIQNVCERLKGYTIDGSVIRCESGEALLTLIPSVQSLLRRFPGVLDATKRAFTSYENRKRIYEVETLRHIKESITSFIMNTESKLLISKFVNSTERAWLLVAAQGTAVSLSKVCQSLPNEANRLVLSLSRLVQVNERLVSLQEHLEANQIDKMLIVIEADHLTDTDDHKKVRDILQSLVIVMKRKRNIKIIYIAEEETVSHFYDAFFIFREVFKSTNDPFLEWGDLTKESRYAILTKKTVFLQGRSEAVSFADLIGIENCEAFSGLLDTQHLMRLIKDERIKVGKELKRLGDSDAAYVKVCREIQPKILRNALSIDNKRGCQHGNTYLITGLGDKIYEKLFIFLGEVFGTDVQNNQHFEEEMEVLLKDRVEAESVILTAEAMNEDGLRNFCKDYKGKGIVHWISSKGGSFMWEKSFDPKFYLNRRFNFHENGFNSSQTEDRSVLLTEDELLSKVTNGSVLIIDEPGMGKSTTLIRLLNKIVTVWVIHTNLRDVREEALKNLPGEDENYTGEAAVLFLTSAGGLEAGSLDAKTVKYLLDNEDARGKLLFAFDGFDEITGGEENRRRVRKLLEFLKNAWVTARPHEAGKLETSLKVRQTSFEALVRSQQENYLRNAWRIRLDLAFNRSLLSDVFSDGGKFNRYSDALLMKADAVLGANDLSQHFIGIPLQLRLLAEGFLDDFEEFVAGDEEESSFEDFNVALLYRKFVDRKINIYLQEKMLLAEDLAVRLSRFTSSYTEMHRRLGLIEMFGETGAHLVGVKSPVKELTDGQIIFDPDDVSELLRIGLVQSNDRRDLEYIHRTFAEYFTAEELAERLERPLEHHENVKTLDFFLRDVLVPRKTRVLVTFLDARRPVLSSWQLSFFGERLHNFWADRTVHESSKVNVFHWPIIAGCEHLVNLIVNSLRDHESTLREMVVAKDTSDDTAIEHAIFQNRLEILKMLIKREPPQIFFNHMLARHTLNKCVNVCGNWMTLWLLTWVLENVGRHAVRTILINTNTIESLLNYCLTKCEAFEAILDWLTIHDIDTARHFIFGKEPGRETIIHYLTVGGLETYKLYADSINEMFTKTLLFVLTWLRKNETEEDILRLICAKDDEGISAIHRAAKNSMNDACWMLWETVLELDESCLRSLLLGEGFGESLLCSLLKSEKCGTMLQFFCEYSQKHLKENDLMALCNGIDSFGCPLLHAAALRSTATDLEFLISWLQSNNALHKFTFQLGLRNDSLLHMCVYYDRFDNCQIILQCFKEQAWDLMNGRNGLGSSHRSPLHFAVERDSPHCLDYFLWWAFSEDIVKAKDLLLSFNNNGDTLLHSILLRGMDPMKTLYEVITQLKVGDEITSDILKAVNLSGESVLHTAVYKRCRMLDYLLNWMTEVLGFQGTLAELKSVSQSNGRAYNTSRDQMPQRLLCWLNRNVEKDEAETLVKNICRPPDILVESSTVN